MCQDTLVTFPMANLHVCLRFLNLPHVILIVTKLIILIHDCAMGDRDPDLLRFLK